MEHTLEKQLPESDLRRPNSCMREDGENYSSSAHMNPEP